MMMNAVTSHRAYRGITRRNHHTDAYAQEGDTRYQQTEVFSTRGYAKRRNGFLLGLRYANVSLAHSGVESS